MHFCAINIYICIYYSKACAHSYTSMHEFRSKEAHSKCILSARLSVKRNGSECSKRDDATMGRMRNAWVYTRASWYSLSWLDARMLTSFLAGRGHLLLENRRRLFIDLISDTHKHTHTHALHKFTASSRNHIYISCASSPPHTLLFRLSFYWPHSANCLLPVEPVCQ